MHLAYNLGRIRSYTAGRCGDGAPLAPSACCFNGSPAGAAGPLVAANLMLVALGLTSPASPAPWRVSSALGQRAVGAHPAAHPALPAGAQRGPGFPARRAVGLPALRVGVQRAWPRRCRPARPSAAPR